MTAIPHHRLLIGTLAMLATAVLAVRIPTAGAAAKPVGGTIKIEVVASLIADNGKQSLVVTGAFADAGIFAQGSPGKAKLSAGAFTADDARAAAHERYVFSHLGKYVNPRTCAMHSSYTAPVKLSHGTRAYAGIIGTIRVTTTDTGVFPRHSDGRCNLSGRATPIGFLSVGHGSGHVSFK